MSNPCTTEIRFHGDESALTDLFEKVRHAISKEAHPDKHGCDIDWLGNITEEFGIDFKKEGVSVRGSIIDVDYDSFIIYTETAWVPKLKMWNVIIGKCYTDLFGDPTIFFDWIAEEFGCEIYCTNSYSEFGDRRYCVDYSIGNYTDVVYSADGDDIIDEINKALETADMEPISSITEIEELNDRFDCGIDYFVIFHELEEVDTCYFD